MDEIKLYPSNDYPTPLDASGSNLVHIGRIRKDLNYPNNLRLYYYGQWNNIRNS